MPMQINIENLVIGRGPVGVIACKRIIDLGFTVLNIDIGDDIYKLINELDVKSNINFTGVSKLPSIAAENYQYHWGGACMGWQYFHNDKKVNGQKKWGKDSNISLPIDIDVFQKACVQLTKILGITNFNFKTNKPRFKIMSSFTPNSNLIFATLYSDPKFTKLITELHGSELYSFNKNFRVNSLICSNNKVKVIGVDTISNKPVVINAEKIFLAAGAINNTKILLESDLDIPSKELLGKNLSDHLCVPIAEIYTSRIFRIVKLLGYKKPRKGNKLWPRLSLSSDISDTHFEHKMLDSFCYATDIAGLTKISNKLIAISQSHPIIQNFLSFLPIKGKFKLNLFSEMFNSLDNKIIKNKYSIYEINLNVSLNDQSSIISNSEKYIQIIKQILPVTKIVTYFTSIKNLDLNSIQAGSHPSGTYRMSANSYSGIVDANSNLHMHKNIFVLGSGVFSRSGATHPTFPSMVLAILAVNSILLKS